MSVPLRVDPNMGPSRSQTAPQLDYGLVALCVSGPTALARHTTRKTTGRVQVYSRADIATAVTRLGAWMTLGRLTIFSDCSLSTSLAHLSTTVLGQAFVCAAAATLRPSWASRDGKTLQRSRGGLPALPRPLRGPRLSPWPLLGVPGFGQVIVFWEGRHPSQSSRHSPAASRPSRQIGTLATSTCLPPQLR